MDAHLHQVLTVYEHLECKMHFDITAAGKALQPVEVCKDSLRHNSFKHHASKATDKNVLFFLCVLNSWE